MNKKIRIGAVSYLNTKPLLLGFDKNEWNIIEEYPSILAQKLLNDEIDIGLVPVAVIPLLKEYYIISDFCIGAEGLVDSVGIFSEVPMDQIETVVLDYQSKTSVNLAKVLLKYYWKKEVVFEDAREDFIDHIKVEEEANRKNISLRTGCFCNPGGGELALGLSAGELKTCFGLKPRMEYEAFRRCINDKSTGAVRISVGLVTNFEDVYRFIDFVQMFIDHQAY